MAFASLMAALGRPSSASAAPKPAAPGSGSGAGAGAAGAVAPSSATPTTAAWSCATCTFGNAAAATACEMCGTPKGGAAVAKPPPPMAVSGSMYPAAAAAAVASATPRPPPAASVSPKAAAAPVSVAGSGAAASVSRTCPGCTFFNAPNAMHCEMCLTPFAAPLKAPAAAPPAASASDAKSKSSSSSHVSGVGGGSFVLSDTQRAEFYRNGYLILKNVVPPTSVAAALRAINTNLGAPQTAADVAKAKAGSWFPKVAVSPAITDLFNRTAARACASQLIAGTDGAARDSTVPFAFAGQIALRFPGTLCTDARGVTPLPWWSRCWHIDGFHSRDNGIPRGAIRNFTCLVGVVLSDVPGPFHGNFVVYPRSHRVMEQYFQRNGFDAVKNGGLEALPRLPLAQPVQVTAAPGDVILAHYMLAHSIAPNTSPHIRYAIYFRVNCHSDKGSVGDGSGHHPQSMLDIWSEWPAMRPLVERDRQAAATKPTAAAPGGPLTAAGEVEGETGGAASDAIRPVYADELYRAQDQFAEQKDRERAAAREAADKLFEAHEWVRAAQAYGPLATQLTDDWEVQLRAGCAFTFTPDDADCVRGEPFLRAAADLNPTFPNVWSVLALNLNRQKRPADALGCVWKMLRCPPPAEPELNPKHNPVVDGLKYAAAALAMLDTGVGVKASGAGSAAGGSAANTTGGTAVAAAAGASDVEMKALIAEASRVYPHYASLVKDMDQTLSGDALWVKAKLWLDAPVKDFAKGEQLFRALVAARPKDYFATLLLGGCIAWSGRPAQGEPYIRAALALDPALPNAYAALAQCLAVQWFKAKDAFGVVDDMIGREFKAVSATNPDARKQIIDALAVAEKTAPGGGGRNGAAFKAVRERAIKCYPAVAQQIKQLYP